MRTARRLFERLCDADHLDRAAEETVQGKRRRADVAWFLFRREAELSRLASELASGTYAAHVVAAAVTAALKSKAEVLLVFGRMLSLLKPMHDGNPSWGPMYVRHPGNVRRCRAYN